MASRSSAQSDEKERVRLSRLQLKVNGHCTRSVGRNVMFNLTGALDWSEAATEMALQLWDAFVMAKRNINPDSVGAKSTLQSTTSTLLKKGHYAVKRLEIPAIALHVQQVLALSSSTDSIARLTNKDYRGLSSVRRIVQRLDRMRREMSWPTPEFYTRVLGSAMQALVGQKDLSCLATLMLEAYLEEVRVVRDRSKEIMTRFDVAGATLASVANDAWDGMQADLRICTSRVSPQRRQWRTPPTACEKKRPSNQFVKTTGRASRKKRKRELDIELDARPPKKQVREDDEHTLGEQKGAVATQLDQDHESQKWTWVCHRPVAPSTWRVYTNQWRRYLSNSSVRALAHEAARRSKF